MKQIKLKQKFFVSFNVDQDKLAPLIQVLSNEVSDLNVKPMDSEPIQTLVMPKRNASKRGSPVTDCMRAWIKSLPAGKQFTADDARKALKAGGFKESNYAPCLSNIDKEGSNLFTSPKKGLYIRRGK